MNISLIYRYIILCTILIRYFGATYLNYIVAISFTNLNIKRRKLTNKFTRPFTQIIIEGYRCRRLFILLITAVHRKKEMLSETNS